MGCGCDDLDRPTTDKVSGNIHSRLRPGYGYHKFTTDSRRLPCHHPQYSEHPAGLQHALNYGPKPHGPEKTSQ